MAGPGVSGVRTRIVFINVKFMSAAAATSATCHLFGAGVYGTIVCCVPGLIMQPGRGCQLRRRGLVGRRGVGRHHHVRRGRRGLRSGVHVLQTRRRGARGGVRGQELMEVVLRVGEGRVDQTRPRVWRGQLVVILTRRSRPRQLRHHHGRQLGHA